MLLLGDLNCPPADMSKPIYRRLLEQRWREEGVLDLLVRCLLTI